MREQERAGAASSDGRDRWDEETTIKLSSGWTREEAEQRIGNALDEAMDSCQFEQSIYGQIQGKNGSPKMITAAYPDFITKFEKMLSEHDTDAPQASGPGTVAQKLAVLIGRLDGQHDSVDKLQESTDIEFPPNWHFKDGEKKINTALAKAMKGRSYNQQLFCRLNHGGKRHSTGRGYIGEYRKKYPELRRLLAEALAHYDPANQKE